MKFSIIVPCYNQSQYLFGVIDNIAKSTQHDHEVIIINDGSTKPRTVEMLEKLSPAGSHQHLVKINQENMGLANTRNVGLNKARGEFIQFLDADDMLVAGKLDRQAALMDREELDIAIDEYLIGDENLCEFRNGDHKLCDYVLTLENIALEWERGMSIPVHCPLIRRSSLGNIRFGSDMRAKEDWLFWMLFFAEPRRYAFTGVVGAIYRVHASSMTRSDNRSNGLQWLKAIEKSRILLSDGFGDGETSAAIKHFNDFYLKHYYINDGAFNKSLFGNYLRNIVEDR
ncbi:glycosyltransferase family 2 protein [Rhizobium alvei]|uniref:Glycosyltransferase family A protein n=1 Tax=Rhizobium alvei TaxID=1132659 RepID=A0ABT8YQN7_9HYPH|nr:glycosyltransferase family A protein [Rhizobium alvei]MDO6965500.1 glycosyltransferase family A protein [Rhizobium alvei]